MLRLSDSVPRLLDLNSGWVHWQLLAQLHSATANFKLHSLAGSESESCPVLVLEFH